KHRLEFGYRSNCAGSAYLIGNSIQARADTLGLVFVSNCPPRTLCSKPQLNLLFNAVNLNDHTISFERKVIPFCFPFVDVGEDFINVAALPVSRGYVEPPLLQFGNGFV